MPIRSPDQYNTDSSSDASRATGPTTGSITPPSNHGSDPALDTQLQKAAGTPTRPPALPLAGSSRNSVSGMSGLGAPASHGQTNLPRSDYEPRFLNAPGARPVYQKAFLLYGTIGDPSRHTVDDGYITVSSNTHHFPPTSWPVHGSHWKAVVYLEPGMNELKFTTWAPKLANNTSSNPIHTAYMHINMVPPHCAPPLQLAIVVAKDSPETFDCVPARAEKDGNGLSTAIRKYRTASYLWQAYLTEQMRRHGMGPRCFTFEEEWVRSTSHMQDRENGVMRSEARVHIIHLDKTVAELRGLDSDALFNLAAQGLVDYFKPAAGEKRYVSALLLDSHWDSETQSISGHVSRGGSVGGMNLAVFGSHCLQSYPSGLDEVWLSMEDCSRTDLDHVANDRNCAGSSWEAATFGIASQLQEIGRMFGLQTQRTGIMSQDMHTFNRSFTTREPFSTRTKSKAGFVLDKDECTLHRLDALRLRFHPCFRIPTNGLFKFDDSVQAYPIDTGKVVLQAKSGLTHIELWAENDEFCDAWIGIGSERGLRNHYTLTEQDVKDRLPEEKRRGSIRVKIFSGAGGCLEIADFQHLASKASALKLTTGPLATGPLGKLAYRSKRVGPQSTDSASDQEVVFQSATKSNRVLSRITVYSDDVCVYGLEFIYDDTSSQLLGSKNGAESGQTYDLDLRRGDYITGFYVKAADCITGIGIMTSLGNCSPVYGDPFNGVT